MKYKIAIVLGLITVAIPALAQYGGGYPGARYNGQQDMLSDLLTNGGSSVTGSGAIVLQTSPTITSPTLNHPSLVGTVDVVTPPFKLSGVNWGNHYTAGPTYNAIYLPNGSDYAFQAGDSTDPTNYYNNTTHRWRGPKGTTTYAMMNASSVSISGISFAPSGNIERPAWTTSGIRYQNSAATFTDTSSSGTVATAYTSAFGGNTIAARSSTTFTNYFGAYFTAPTAGTNVTFTQKYALGADSIYSAGGISAVSDVNTDSGFRITTNSSPTLTFGVSGNPAATFANQGFGTYTFKSDGNTLFRIVPNSGPDVNYMQVAANVAGNNPFFSAAGSDTNIGFAFIAKGAGNIRFNGAGGSTVLAAFHASTGVSIGQDIDSGTATLNIKPVVFASLTSCNATIKGSIAAITDSTTVTWASSISGGGANNVLGFCNGTNWTVLGS